MNRRDRAIAAALLAIGAAAAYVPLNLHPLRPPAVLPWSAIDRAIPFVPQAAVAYLAFYVLVAAPIALARSRREAARYVAAGIAAAAGGAIVFAIAPTMVARPPAAPGSLLALVQAVDSPVNACPSLHAALAAIAVIALAGRRRWWMAMVAGIAVVASAALTKQHGVLDLAAGLGLGLAVAAIALEPGDAVGDGAPSASEMATRAAATAIAARTGADLAALRTHRIASVAMLIAPAIAWFAAALMIVAGGWWAAAGIVLAALALNALFLVIHEAVHATLPLPARIGDVVGSAIGAIAFASYAAYRIMHLRHHRYLGDPRDPDDYANWTRSRRRRIALHWQRLAVATLIYLVAVPILAWRSATGAQRRWMLGEAAAIVLLHTAAAWLLGPTWWLITLAPLVLANVLINARGLTQHTACVADDPLRASRSVRAGLVVRMLLLNENYHLEHHLFPSVPGCRLHDLHRVIAPALAGSFSARSYHGFVARFLAATLRGDDGPLP